MKEQKKIIAKVKSLLALSDKTRNNSDSEADLALGKAHELLAKHQLCVADIHQLDENNAFYEEIIESKIDTKSSRLSTKNQLLMDLLEDHFCVYQYRDEQYVDGKSRVFVALIGRESSITVAKYVFHYLSEEFERRWNSHKKRIGVRRSEKRGFFYGIYHGLHQKLMENARAMRTKESMFDNKPTQDLMNIDQAIRDYVRKHHPKMGSYCHGSPFYKNSYEDGIHAGNSINIRSAVEKGSTPKKVLLLDIVNGLNLPSNC